MFDTRPALADMAAQIRSCRTADGLTLQKLASRSGVAASTIHKVESQQMVPTVSVLLKIAMGLGRRPEELVRDEIAMSKPATSNRRTAVLDSRESQPNDSHRASVWRIDVAHDRPFPPVLLDSNQRAIVLVEQGTIQVRAGEQRIEMNAGDCIEVEGGRSIESFGDQRNAASLTLIVSPPGTGNIERSLGAANANRAAQTAPDQGRLGSIPNLPGSQDERDLNTDCL